MSAEPTFRRLFLWGFAALVALVSLITLIEILRVPVGACELNPGSAACARQRIVILLPWLGMGVALYLFWLRIRRQNRTARTFVAERRGGKPLARLYVIEGQADMVSQSINLYGSTTVIGRDPALADVTLYKPRDRSTISARHCTIRYDRGQFTLIDHDTPNGTQVNGRPVRSGVPIVLKDGDEITLGDAARQGAILRFQAVIPALGVLPAEMVVQPVSDEQPSKREDMNKTFVGMLRAKQREAPGDDPLLALIGNVRREGRESRDNLGVMLDPDDDQAWNPARYEQSDDNWMKDLS